MTRRQIIIAILLLSGLEAGRVLAHEEFKLAGTITSRKGFALQVKLVDGRTSSVWMSEGTTVWRDQKQVQSTEVKPGQAVVIYAYGDSDTDCAAWQIHLVPKTATTRE